MGPRVHDMEVKDLLDIILRIKAGAYSFEASNPRHEHEWKVWGNAKLPKDSVLIPGVISHSTVLVEHPELVAERIARFASLVGRERVIAGSDCGFATFAGSKEIHPSIVWAKFEALVEAWPVLRDRSGLGRHFDILADYSDADFERLLATLGWFLANPASGMYVRQLPIEGIDTKWLEKRTGVVTELLTLLRGDEHRRDFHDVCGLLRTPHRIRMRVLCPLLRLDIGGLTDLEVPIEQLAALALRPKAVLIVENLETGLALPDMDGVVAFMRMGNSVNTLSRLPWLEDVPAVYWGDIDTHGLAILSRARRALPRIRSVLMDEATLQAHEPLWSTEPSQHAETDLTELTVDERAVFDGLRTGRWGAKLRLEQERLPWDEALAEVERTLVLACASEKSLRHADVANAAGRIGSLGADLADTEVGR